jgi:hypothetical protein
MCEVGMGLCSNRIRVVPLRVKKVLPFSSNDHTWYHLVLGKFFNHQSNAPLDLDDLGRAGIDRASSLRCLLPVRSHATEP